MTTRALLLLALLVDPPRPGAFVDVAEGVRLRAQPSATARSLAVVDAPQPLEVLETAEGWVRVRYGSFTGWLKPEGDGGGPGVEAPPPRGPDRERLARALAALSRAAPAVPFGPFDLHTDVPDAATRSSLEKTALALPAVYAERYGVRPALDGSRDAVVLFADASGYAAFVAGDESLAGADTRGHAARGVAALSLSSEGIGETRGLLAHELTHLLNRRALGALVPPWLEEGIAEDLAMCRFAAGGQPLPGTLRVRVERERTGLVVSGQPVLRDVTWRRGPLASVEALREKARRGELTPLAALLSRSAREFVSKEGRAESYPLAALFVRFLLADGVPRSREAFRAFLEGVALGESPSHQRLLQLLGVDLGALDGAFRRWVRD